MPHRTALVLSGGGARGAYEVGVVRYLREGLPKTLGRMPSLDVICGTSVGAVNACFLAATAEAPEAQGRSLSQLWTSLDVEKVFGWGKLELLQVPFYLFRRARQAKKGGPNGTWRMSDFVYPQALTELIRSSCDFSRIRGNVEEGRLHALTVTATDLGTGRSVVFLQIKGPPPPWSRDPFVEARPRDIGPEHALASAAIPLLFRPVRIEGAFFSDGSIRQNTPIGPALRLGASRVLVVGLRYHGRRNGPQPPSELEETPGTMAQLGRMMNALLLDHTDYDLDRLRRFNTLLEQGEAAFGKDFQDRLNDAVTRSRGAPYRRVRDLVIRPSQDIADIARKHADRLATRISSGTVASRLLRVAAGEGEVATGAADLASYLLFDGPYLAELMDLGYRDAEAHRAELEAFFAEE